CSTWGFGHFRTFDDFMYDFIGKCNYLFASSDDDNLIKFSVQLQRKETCCIEKIKMMIADTDIQVNKDTIKVNKKRNIELPYSKSGIEISQYGMLIKLVAKSKESELAVIWNKRDLLIVEVDNGYQHKTSGLCGDFNGHPVNDEFENNAYQFVDSYKEDEDELEEACHILKADDMPKTCLNYIVYEDLCTELVNSVAPRCTVPKKRFVIRCQQDMNECHVKGGRSCACATFSEYSRQCSRALQKVEMWRLPGFCYLGRCPGNQVFQEYAPPLIPTCSNQAVTSTDRIYGCVCPKDMVLDDLSGKSFCVKVSNCPCELHSKIYFPGQIVDTPCQICECTNGNWDCRDQPCPGRCSVEGGSLLTTFDYKQYHFHGICIYLLMKSPLLPNHGSLNAVFSNCDDLGSSTCLTAIIYKDNNNTIRISNKETISVNDEHEQRLPYIKDGVTVFRQTSTYLQMNTDFGLEIEIMIDPIFSVFLKIDADMNNTLTGLCGNYNNDPSDDLMSSNGGKEDLASKFVDSWQVIANCNPAIDEVAKSCNENAVDNEHAKSKCSVLQNKNIFGECHEVEDPDSYYKWCIYEYCYHEHKRHEFFCAAVGSYARVCASKGIAVSWRSYTNCHITCPHNQIYFSQSEACGKTCASHYNPELECYASDFPLDGCNCPANSYLDDKGKCVKSSECPCFVENNSVISSGYQAKIGEEFCHCTNATMMCGDYPSKQGFFCRPPQDYFDCKFAGKNEFGAACAPSCQLLATDSECCAVECMSGCMCPSGLYLDGEHGCVTAEDCSCMYNGISYSKGETMMKDCERCICTRGKWYCTEKHNCPSTCVLSGEGHIITFDGRPYSFESKCEYVLVQDGCKMNDTQTTFKVAMEDVACDAYGPVCFREIKVQMKGFLLRLSAGQYKLNPPAASQNVTITQNSLYIIFEFYIPGGHKAALIWNKNKDIFIKINRAAPKEPSVCGLCGNYNGNLNDDFMMRNKYVASNVLEFVNSWKEHPSCDKDVKVPTPCLKNPHRKAWAKSKCLIIKSIVFVSCHSKVNHVPYFEACVNDACECNFGGDCECLCDAVAVYAKACLDAGVCIDWRRPDFCPVYCDFYNIHDLNVTTNVFQYSGSLNCTWHYKPCLCVFKPWAYKGINIEGCYHCGPDEYYNPETGTCDPCVIITTPPTIST
uniref:VWFD domain-containing protein n=1 Tax=Latimeria chalumnae TaxID=7897 RepID=H3A6Q0_LATCH